MRRSAASEAIVRVGEVGVWVDEQGRGDNGGIVQREREREGFPLWKSTTQDCPRAKDHCLKPRHQGESPWSGSEVLWRVRLIFIGERRPCLWIYSPYESRDKWILGNRDRWWRECWGIFMWGWVINRRLFFRGYSSIFSKRETSYTESVENDSRKSEVYSGSELDATINSRAFSRVLKWGNIP
jgi:hypothetical protein